MTTATTTLLRCALRGAFFVCILCFSTIVSAQDKWLHWKYKDYDGSKSFSLPGWTAEMASWFIKERDTRRLVRKVNKVRFTIFEEGDNPVSPKDWKRFAKKAKKRGLEDLITVNSKDAKVRIMARESNSGGSLSKMVILVNADDMFVMTSIKGRLRYDDINKMIRKYKEKQPETPNDLKMPDLSKVPVLKV
jgi:Domain of unknown function (DUF4252)